MIVSIEQRRALVELSEGEMEDFAEAIAEVTRRYDNLFETSFPYSKFLISFFSPFSSSQPFLEIENG